MSSFVGQPVGFENDSREDEFTLDLSSCRVPRKAIHFHSGVILPHCCTQRSKEANVDKHFAFRGLAGFVLVGGLTGGAMAQSAPPGATAVEGGPVVSVEKMHCAVRIDPVKKGETFSSATEIGCYNTFAQAIGAATDGRVKRPDLTPDSISESDLAGSDAGSLRVALIGIDYDGRGFTGASLSWFTADLTGCFSPGTFFRANMPAFFNNRLTSTRAFSGCRKNDSFPGFNLTGLGIRCFPNCSYVGNFWNNTTSSKRWLR
jgi:hypothetical protein